jgi:hypothetical protein
MSSAPAATANTNSAGAAAVSASGSTSVVASSAVCSEAFTAHCTQLLALLRVPLPLTASTLHHLQALFRAQHSAAPLVSAASQPTAAVTAHTRPLSECETVVFVTQFMTEFVHALLQRSYVRSALRLSSE